MHDSSPTRNEMLSLVGLGVTFAVFVMTLAFLELPSEGWWTMVFLLPVVFFAMLLHRARPDFQVHSGSATALMLLIAVVTFFVPRVDWAGPGIIGLAAISLVFGVLVGVLVDRSWPRKTSSSESIADTTTAQ